VFSLNSKLSQQDTLSVYLSQQYAISELSFTQSPKQTGQSQEKEMIIVC